MERNKGLQAFNFGAPEIRHHLDLGSLGHHIVENQFRTTRGLAHDSAADALNSLELRASLEARELAHVLRKPHRCIELVHVWLATSSAFLLDPADAALAELLHAHSSHTHTEHGATSARLHTIIIIVITKATNCSNHCTCHSSNTVAAVLVQEPYTSRVSPLRAKQLAHMRNARPVHTQRYCVPECVT